MTLFQIRCKFFPPKFTEDVGVCLREGESKHAVLSAYAEQKVKGKSRFVTETAANNGGFTLGCCVYYAVEVEEEA